MKRKFFLLILVVLATIGQAQKRISGVVVDAKGEPVFAANVYPLSNPQRGTITNLDGSFALSFSSTTDTLVVSFVGFQAKRIPFSTMDLSQGVTIELQEQSSALGAVVIKAQDPISEKFSVVKMQKMDIYLNPVAQGDPLKAITVLPASTTTDESANPSLRGSSADRSRVVLNGVPIYSPVKASMMNNIGFFSLLNPEIIDNQYVYASNPPLTYGNTSAGLVEIQTIKSIENSNLQLSSNLVGLGILKTQAIEKGKSFVQVYGNYQISDAFVAIQRDALPHIKRFDSKDAGLNFNKKFDNGMVFNSFSYYINEGYRGISNFYAYKGDVSSSNSRFFSVNNLKRITNKGVLSLNSGFNTSAQHFGFGNIQSDNGIGQLYTSIDYKWFILPTSNLQLGVSHDYQRNGFKSTVPIFYFAMSPDSPSYSLDTTIYTSRLEAYIYSSWDISKRFTLSSGARFRIPTHGEKHYYSTQLGLKYSISSRQWLLLNGGMYHSYTTPNYYHMRFSMLKSTQVALDYVLDLSDAKLTAALYAKEEAGEQITNTFYSMDNVKTLGAEIYLEKELGKKFRVTIANSYIIQTLDIEGKEYKGSNNMAYLLKASVQYSNPKLVNLTINFIGRPGKNYTPVVGADFHSPSGFYEPIFDQKFLGSQYSAYNRVDISLSKYIPLNRNAFIAFLSVNNLLNLKNQKSDFYNFDYTSIEFDYYTLRTIFFGVVWHLNR